VDVAGRAEGDPLVNSGSTGSDVSPDVPESACIPRRCSWATTVAGPKPRTHHKVWGPFRGSGKGNENPAETAAARSRLRCLCGHGSLLHSWPGTDPEKRAGETGLAAPGFEVAPGQYV